MKAVWKISLFAMLAPEALLLCFEKDAPYCYQTKDIIIVPCQQTPEPETLRYSTRCAQKFIRMPEQSQTEQTPRSMPLRYLASSSHCLRLSTGWLWLRHNIKLRLLGITSTVGLLHVAHVGEWRSATSIFCWQWPLHGRRLVGTSIGQRTLLHSTWHTNTSTGIHSRIDEV